MSQVTSHYGPFNSIPKSSFDVPISINIPRVTSNLQKNVGFDIGSKIQLLQQIVDEVTKSVPATREVNVSHKCFISQWKILTFFVYLLGRFGERSL